MYSQICVIPMHTDNTSTYNMFQKSINFTINIQHYMLYTIAVSGQECTDTVTVGSLIHDNNIATLDQTFILAGYTVPCSGTVVAWEFCYRISAVASVTFYPGVWRITGTMSGNTDYTLVQSNTVTYDPSGDPANLYPCQVFNLSDTDQFTAPAGSVVGLYSNVGIYLLHTNTDNSTTTYQFSGNKSSINNAGNNDDINYNIAIRVHLGKFNGNDFLCLLAFTVVYIATRAQTNIIF